MLLLQESLAKQQIRNAGLKPRVGKRRASGRGSERGAVIDQNPAAGDRIGKGSSVTIWVSTGKPAIDGSRRAEPPRSRTRSARLTAAGLTYNIVYLFSGQAEENTVTGQNPAPGRSRPARLEGPDQRLAVAPVRFRSRRRRGAGANAVGALKGSGLVVTQVQIESDEPAGAASRQEPSAGTPVTEGHEDHAVGVEGPAARRSPT